MSPNVIADLWPRLSMPFSQLSILILASLILLSVPRILARLMRQIDTLWTSRTFQGLIQWLPRLRPLLTPHSHFDPDMLATTGIVPHHVTVGRSGRIGMVSYLRMSTLRPSSPKVACVLACRPRLERADAWDDPAVDGVGGFRLTLYIGDWDNARHVLDSLKWGDNSRPAKTVYYCTPRAYLSTRGAVHAITINRGHVYTAKDCAEAIVAFSADPHHFRLEQHRIIRRDEADDGRFWLLVPKTNLDAPEHACSTAHSARTGNEPESGPNPPQEQRTRPSGRERDPWNQVCWSRYIVSTGLLLLPPAAVRGWTRLDPETWYWEVGLFLLLIALFICWFALLRLMVNHIVRYCIEKRRHSWTATRCIADGTRFRNGLRKCLPADARRTVHQERANAGSKGH